MQQEGGTISWKQSPWVGAVGDGLSILPAISPEVLAFHKGGCLGYCGYGQVVAKGGDA